MLAMQPAYGWATPSDRNFAAAVIALQQYARLGRMIVLHVPHTVSISALPTSS